ncbi:uncharacterized protein LOC133819177 [Humulus lupulus]|uniref:uncharacterized protein LOC133819177 n=1 Tax=Humulus lupulus TaxID=3486 RepID=UPI002B40B148|nr:uncharacterized protein LOC133819177 [Humulus lupulus]
MAGGNHAKGPSHKPSTASTATSASHRKSRWDPPSNTNTNTNSNTKSKATTATTTNTKSPATDPKTPKPKIDSSPKPGPTPSPAQPKPTTKDPPSSRPGNPHTDPSPGSHQFPFPDPAALGPPPPPAYGFHMLERRSIALADGSVRSYFALPPDYQDFPIGRFGPPGHGYEMGGLDRRFPHGGPTSPGGGRYNRNQDYWNSLGLDGRGPGEGSLKRKYSEEEEKEKEKDLMEDFAKRRQHEQHYLPYGNPNGFPAGHGHRGGEFSAGNNGEDSRSNKYMRDVGGLDNNVGFRQGSGSGGGAGGGDQGTHKHLEVDQSELKKSFLRFTKVINESANQRKNYLENGKHSRLQCVACGRSSKDFPDMHSLIMHTYNLDNADLRVDHLGLHKALCVLMGWSYSKPPDNSKAYQFLSADEAAANRDDLVIWPPMVIIHNTLTGKNKEGRMEGLGNKVMDSKIREFGCTVGKSKSLYGREGHLGTTLIKFSSDQAGLKEANRLAEYFDRDNRGRRAWARLQPLTLGSKDDENNPHLMTFDERTREKKRIFYAYLGTASDLDKIDFETRKKVVIESQREYRASN